MSEITELAGFDTAFATALAGVLVEVGPILDERQKRVLAGAGARQLGHGGIKLVAAATGVSGVLRIFRTVGPLKMGVH
ncbi:hypothetical protein FB472_1395 [Rhodoglobus vestalii]|uniref:Uncharacterized protein n=1 Tax=Rhodoglobus vestalii TaxID=193384 RepID=A0A8H2K4U1_9MICO|nr:hypothetical protein FB472_1395 [Rhodoglobus vestalii]